MLNSLDVIFRPAGRKMTSNKHKVPLFLAIATITKKKGTPMRKQYWLLVIAGLAMLVGLAHANASAEGKNGVIDQGRNVYLVDSSKGDLNNLLPSEEVEKIKRLQTESRSSNLISPVSPDDQAALANFGEQ